MKRKIIVLIIIVLLFLGITHILSKSKNENKESTRNVKPIEFTEEIGDNGVGVLLDAKKMGPNKNPLQANVEDLNKFQAQILDENNNDKLKKLYLNSKLSVISKTEFRAPFFTKNKDIYSKIKYKVVFSVDSDSLYSNYQLFEGYIYDDGVFYQKIYKSSKNKPLYIYLKGKFNDKDMKMLQGIYDKAYTHKLHDYK
ncbi:MAG: hypothetical protein ACLTT7_02245 [Paraclostridium bifermentans]|uniref:hypothetical protein n=1 Tax=Paraclostridium bifermentans TaxID=1490 RepID=UPI000A176C9C|nr:hypothetical protein [Paraclostridium bifermentans]OSB08472.1 hypothetical protein B2H97_13975 [Paraclostridium bifermentans]